MNQPTAAAQPLEFTASGSEYFRIWAVNMLLVFVTLGLYLPFAKARRLRYFYANTMFAGQPLAFHGNPMTMFRGYLLMLLLFGGYAAASHFSAWAGVGMFALLALLWPALWRASLRFRLHNTSWRGLRFGFEGSLGEAYAALLPLFAPGLFILAVGAWQMAGVDAQDPAAMKATMDAQAGAAGVTMGAMLLLFPYAFWRMRRYQHRGFRYAGQQGQFDAGAGRFYGLGLKGFGLSLLTLGLFGVAAGITFAALGDWLKRTGEVQAMAPAIGLGALGLVIYLALLLLLGAWFSARLQNLCWNATRSQQLQFESRLSARALAGLGLKNLLLTVLTLGLYRPFAVVNTQRMRLQAVAIAVQGDIDSWVAEAAQTQDGAAGEMSGDFFGIDVGL